MKTNKLLKGLLLVAIIFGFSVSSFAEKNYVADKNKSSVVWVGKKVNGKHVGFVSLKSGVFTVEDDQITSGNFVIDMTSIESTDLEGEKKKKLDDHLRSTDFFSVEKYPEAKLTITESGSFDDGDAEVTGNLTIKGRTHPITFNATRENVDNGVKYFAKINVDRTKYNVRYGSRKFFDNLGDKAIYDVFELKVNILAKPKK